ncbi:hypothetical protein M3Y96_01082000 [Aphelenchoides besseyi]|nr:hypothetical protein M3Y96_01082000 [Aphelenchoides besseyi]
MLSSLLFLFFVIAFAEEQCDPSKLLDFIDPAHYICRFEMFSHKVSTLEIDALNIGFVMESEFIKDVVNSSENPPEFFCLLDKHKFAWNYQSFEWIRYDEKGLLVLANSTDIGIMVIEKIKNLSELSIQSSVLRRDRSAYNNLRMIRFNGRIKKLFVFYGINENNETLIETFAQQVADNGTISFKLTSSESVSYDLVDLQWNPDQTSGLALIRESSAIRVFRVDNKLRFEATSMKVNSKDRIVALNRGAFILAQWQHGKRSLFMYTSKKREFLSKGCVFDEFDDTKNEIYVRLSCKKRFRR